MPDGIAHYLEHKLFDMPDGEVSEKFARLGANVNAFTGYDMTAYYFMCTDRFDQSLRLLLEFVSTPYFTEQSVQKEQGIIGQEIDMNLDNPDTQSFERLVSAAFRNHPVTHPILGTRQSIGEITPEVLALTHRVFYRPDNMLLCVVGDVSMDEICSIAQEVLPAQPEEKVTSVRTWQEEMTCPEALTTCQMEVAMPNFLLGFKCEPLERGAEAIRREFVGDLAAEALFGESSGLYLKMYDEGLIDSGFGGGFDTVAERIYKFPQVKSVILMSGPYDLLVTVEGKSLKEISMFVAERLAPMESVVSTATHFELKTYKKDGVLFTEKEEDNREVISI